MWNQPPRAEAAPQAAPVAESSTSAASIAAPAVSATEPAADGAAAAAGLGADAQNELLRFAQQLAASQSAQEESESSNLCHCSIAE
jgi:hypothetical protein